MKKRAIDALLILTIFTSGILVLGRLTPGHNWGGDFSAYIMQAKSITEVSTSAFIESNRFTVEQSTRPIGPIAYPWGFPLLLAPIYAIFDLNVLALKFVGVFSFLFFLLVLWFGFRSVHTTPWLICLLFLFAFNPTLIAFSNNILSDIPFLLVSTICVLAIQKIIAEDHLIFSRRTDLIFLGTVIATAFVIRTNGILLLVTLAFSYMLSHFQKKSLSEQPQGVTGAHQLLSYSLFGKQFSVRPITLLFTPCAVFVCSIIIWKLLFPSGGASHISHLKDISVLIIKSHLSYYLDLLTAFFSGAPHSHLLYGASIPVAIVGAFRRYKRDYPAIIYIVLTALLYIIWPAKQGIRFLFPILPFYISFVCSGLEAFGSGTTAVERALRRALSFSPIVVVVFFFLFNDIRATHWHFNFSKNFEIEEGPFTQTSQQVFSFLVQHTDSDSIIIFFKPRVMKLMTGRQSILINRVEQLSLGDFLCLHLKKNNSQVSENDVKRLLTQEDIRIVYQNDDFKVYRIIKEDEIPVHNNAMHSDGNSAVLHSRR